MGPGKFTEEGQDALQREFPELDDIEAGRVLNTFLGEMGYFSEMGGERYTSKTAADVDPKNIPIAPGIKSKDLKLNESGGAGTGTVTIEFTDVDKAWDFYQNEVA